MKVILFEIDFLTLMSFLKLVIYRQLLVALNHCEAKVYLLKVPYANDITFLQL